VDNIARATESYVKTDIRTSATSEINGWPARVSSVHLDYSASLLTNSRKPGCWIVVLRSSTYLMADTCNILPSNLAREPGKSLIDVTSVTAFRNRVRSVTSSSQN